MASWALMSVPAAGPDAAACSLQVAEARKLGDVGERTRQGDTKVQVAAIDSEVIRNQNLRNQEVEKSKLELRLVETECRQRTEQATVQVCLATPGGYL
jgi:hypothetical protein